ncbi:CdiA C-terminal domain-containing protein [Streptococcus suis]
MKDVDPTKAKLTDRDFWEHGGNKYQVDGHDVVLDYKPIEKETALWLSQTFGRHVEMVPRFNKPENVSTPDYLIGGIPFDRKGIEGSGKYVIDGNLKKAKTQAENVVLDFTLSNLTDEAIMEQMNDIYRSGRRGVDIAILKRGETLIDVIKKKD